MDGAHVISYFGAISFQTKKLCTTHCVLCWCICYQHPLLSFLLFFFCFIALTLSDEQMRTSGNCCSHWFFYIFTIQRNISELRYIVITQISTSPPPFNRRYLYEYKTSEHKRVVFRHLRFTSFRTVQSEGS
jgi:hypothetical protein